MPGNTITTQTHYFCQIDENVHQTGEKKFNHFLKQKNEKRGCTVHMFSNFASTGVDQRKKLASDPMYRI